MQINMALNLRNWTTGAVQCYERGCNCEGCPTKEYITSQKCVMKYSVMELVKKFGKPTKPAEEYSLRY